MVEIIGLSILALVGWLLYLREKSCLNYVAASSDRTVKSLHEAISYKDKTIEILRGSHADLSRNARRVIDLHDKGILLKIGKDSSAIEILRVHANSEV